MKLQNNKAPEFKLKDKDSNFHTLTDFKEEYKVLFFYPKDNTPGCTIESKNFSDLISEFNKLKTKIIGISGGDEKTKTKFCEKHNLSILLLSDTDFSVSKKYKVYGEKQFMGRKYLGISRVTYILDSKNKIIKTFDKVKPLTHANEVLEFIKSLK
jgi:thioredoxin-dependent peroxiredoxin